MNIYSVPMLISGILCALLSVITWLFRRRENINRVFSFFTLALAIDSFAYFMWFQFGSIENIHILIKIINTVGFLIPIGLILFFFAFTRYDKEMDARILGIKVRHFQISAILLYSACMILNLFTELISKIPDDPVNIWDIEDGPLVILLISLTAYICFYMIVMVFKGYRRTDNKPQKRFILLLAFGTVAWILIGFTGVLFFSPSNALWQSINYIGTGIVAVFYFVAIINYQSDKVYDLNLNLEKKVEDRTRELKQMQKQIVVQEKMASLGQLVAGLTHEFNTPIGAIRSMNNTKSKAFLKLQAVLENIAPDSTEKDHEFKKVMGIIVNADQLIDQGTERLNEIITNLKNFVRLDEAEATMADIHECLDSVLALIKHDLLTNIEVVCEYSEIPPFICNVRKLNQVFLNILKNACQAIDDKGRITITTSLKKEKVHIAIRDTGKGITQDDLETIFDPGFTSKNAVVRASLGLSICYQIVHEHQGVIIVDSQPGKGSVFTVVLPMEF